MDIYEITLATGHKLYVECASDMTMDTGNFRLNTFMVFLAVGRVSEIKKLGPVLARLTDTSATTHEKSSQIVNEAREANVSFAPPSDFPIFAQENR